MLVRDIVPKLQRIDILTKNLQIDISITSSSQSMQQVVELFGGHVEIIAIEELS